MLGRSVEAGLDHRIGPACRRSVDYAAEEVDMTDEREREQERVTRRRFLQAVAASGVASSAHAGDSAPETKPERERLAHVVEI